MFCAASSSAFAVPESFARPDLRPGHNDCRHHPDCGLPPSPGLLHGQIRQLAIPATGWRHQHDRAQMPGPFRIHATVSRAMAGGRASDSIHTSAQARGGRPRSACHNPQHQAIGPGTRRVLTSSSCFSAPAAWARSTAPRIRGCGAGRHQSSAGRPGDDRDRVARFERRRARPRR